jgi:hypothetical protein
MENSLNNPNWKENLRRWWPLLLPAFLFFSIGLFRAFPDTIDDAYISFQCSRNVVLGHGLTYNPGTRVEAFSNPLMTFLMIPFLFVGVPAWLGSKMIGITSFLAILFFSIRLVKLQTNRNLSSVLTLALLLCSFPLLYYAITGLETGLLAALLMAATYRWAKQESLDTIGIILWTGIIYTRPEGIAYFFAVVPSFLLLKKENWKSSILSIAIIIGLFILGLLLRRWYYGLWLPNTFYAKAPGSADLNPKTTWFSSSWDYLKFFLIALGGIAPLLALKRALGNLTDFRITLPLAGICGAGVTFAVYAGGDWMPAARYLQPIVPALVVLSVIELTAFTEKPFMIRLKGVFIYGFFASYLLGNTEILYGFFVDKIRQPYIVMSTKDCREAALWMDKNLPEDTTIAAYRIGALGYFSNRPIIDLFGLADHDIALLVGENPDYHPNKEFGEDIPELAERLINNPPKALLPVKMKGRLIKKNITRYNRTYRLEKEFLLGTKESWALYLLEEEN